MKLFLSSFDPHSIPLRLLELLGANRNCCVIANARDADDAEIRSDGLARANVALRALGLDPHELDLRDHDPQSIARALASSGLVWAIGGNAFVLRRAMRVSGFDVAIREALAGSDLVYGGSSAGSIVAGTTLRGVELVDPLDDLRRVGGGAPIWKGMRLVDFAIAPHFGSASEMGDAIARMIDAWATAGTDYRALRDGQSLLVRNGRAVLVDRSK